MSNIPPAPSGLEDRFTPPPGWRWHFFTRDNRKLRFGSAFPQDSIPDAVVVCLPGLSEFGEKYFEVARYCLEHNLAFWVLDWMGQGRSDRYLKNPHKRHSTGFQKDVEDLHYFILEYIKHSSVHPDKGRIPLAMLAHSMGANIGLHYLSQHPGMFECAAMTAPLCAIKALKPLPDPLRLSLTGLLGGIAGKLYVPGGGNWREDMHPAPPAPKSLSSDEARGALHNLWSLHDPALQVGGITFGWLNRAARSCARLRKDSTLAAIQTRCLLAMAGIENLVDNNAAERAAQKIRHAEILQLPESRHEILMERDEIRGVFLDKFYKLIEETIIARPETLKPF
ncbi:MAG: alpha/beta hydrolase [Alphaproteobacteria bacterium]